MNIIKLLKKFFGLSSPTEGPLVDAHNDSRNSNFSRGKNSPVMVVTNNMSANEESLRAKIIELQTENEKLKSELEVVADPILGCLVEKSTGTKICSACYAKYNKRIPLSIINGVWACNLCPFSVEPQK